MLLSFTGGAEVPFFIDAERYTDSYLAGAGSRIDEGEYSASSRVQTHSNTFTGHFEIKVDDRFQYGQKNAAGEKRFIVYHDKARKPYQVSMGTSDFFFKEY